MRKRIAVFLMSLAIAGSFVSLGITVYRSIMFKQNCSGYLKQAADASTVQIAIDKLDIAIQYLEDNNLTQGYTSIVYKTQDEDLGFWYNNIINAREQLKVSLNGSKLEQDNALMRVREALLDNGEKGTELTVPDGISRYPYNLFFAITNTLSIIVLIVLSIAISA